MFVKIPFESTIDFKTNISEITKMSLEHDFNVNDGVILGNFYISGEYRSHEVSVNVEPFYFTLPFSVELRDDIRKDTVEFNIEDFSYEIVDNNQLKVNIEYSLEGEVDEELFQRVDEEELSEEMDIVDEFMEENEIKEEPDEEIDTEIIEESKEEERLDDNDEKTIMETIKTSDDTFVTYHIHIVKENETIDTICNLYNVSSMYLSEYNNIENISMGDKLIIPSLDE